MALTFSAGASILARAIYGDTPEIACAGEAIEIEENLHRRELSPALRKTYTTRLKALHEQEHPKSKGGRPSKTVPKAGKVSKPERFTKAHAKRTGRSEAAVQQDVAARPRWIAVPTGAVALASPAIAGWLFGWSAKSMLDTIIPCSIVLALGYRAVAKPPAERAFARCARIVALVGMIWIGAALVVDAALGFFRLNPFKLYSASDVFADMRFYLGWTLGLLLAPSARREAGGRAVIAKAKAGDLGLDESAN
jgi:hypothetical protein